MSSTDCAVEAHQIVKTYAVRGAKHGIRALDGLDLSVPRGIIYGLLGPNGAGKTTAVKILTSLARPDEGTACVEGIDVLARPGQVRQLIGVVAQRSGADPTATGRENLLLQARLYGLRDRAARARADELLTHFDLTEAAGRLVKTYSGGMQRRLDVALGLIHRPAVLFLDEPTTGLDPESRTAMWQEIARLATHEGLTVLLTTHYLEEADRLAEPARDRGPRPGRRLGNARRAQGRAARRCGARGTPRRRRQRRGPGRAGSPAAGAGGGDRGPGRVRAQ